MKDGDLATTAADPIDPVEPLDEEELEDTEDEEEDEEEGEDEDEEDDPEADEEDSDEEDEDGDEEDEDEDEDGEDDPDEEDDEPQPKSKPKAAPADDTASAALKAMTAQVQAIQSAPLDFNDPKDPKPDVDDDPIAYLKWQDRQNERRDQAIAKRDRLTFIAMREAQEAVTDGAAWQQRVDFFQRIVQRAPSLYDEVFSKPDPVKTMRELTDEFGFKPSDAPPAANPKTPKAKTGSQSKPKPKVPKTLAGVRGGRPEQPGRGRDTSGGDYSLDAWRRMPDAKRKRLLGG